MRCPHPSSRLSSAALHVLPLAPPPPASGNAYANRRNSEDNKWQENA